MRLRRKVRRDKNPPQQQIDDPTPAEREWVESNLHLAEELVRTYATTASGASSLTLLDDAFAAWLASWLDQPEEDRDDPNSFINAFGIAFGQRLVDELGLEWKAVTDADGTEIAVHGQPGDILVFPPNLVAKRFVARETWFLASIYEELARMVDDFRRGVPPIEGS